MLSCQMSVRWGGEGMEGSQKATKVRQHRDAESAGLVMCWREVAEQDVSGMFMWKKTIPKSEMSLAISPQKDPLPVTQNEAEREIKGW